MNAAANRSAKLIKGMTGEWEIVIGMEVHAQVLSQVEAVLRRFHAFGAEPEQRRCPSSMPRCRACFRLSTGNASSRRSAPAWASRHRSTSSRCSTGRTISIPTCPAAIRSPSTRIPSSAKARSSSTSRTARPSASASSACIWNRTRARCLHDQHPDHSYVDLNRSGVALMEIVTKPHMRSSEEAAAFLRKLRAIVRYLGTCDGNMDEGSMRADVNVSVCRAGGYEKFRATATSGIWERAARSRT